MPTKPISISQQMFERFERRKNWRRFVAIFYFIFYATYLLWRCTILNADSLTLSLCYLFAEICGFILGTNVILRSWSYSHRTPKPVLVGRSVDVFIPTYKEPEHIIRRTAMAAKAIKYPHQTWILDDAKRPEIKKIAEELGIKYLSRPQNLHAKAGNLNYALQHSSAEFVMVFDADHIALPHALDLLLGFFADEKVAMVQTPQDYYNTDAFQYMNCKKTGALWMDQSFFYNISEPGCDAANSASCVGTGVVYRRKILDEIGGIPTATLTEDTHTSLKMSKLGYDIVYINEVIAYGIASADLLEYYKTRRRWTHGNIHVLKDEKIFSCKELTWRKRLKHISPMFYVLEGWQQLLLIFIPIGTLIFGLSPFEISVFNVLITFCFPFLSYAMLQEIGCGFSRLWTNEIFAMIRWPIYLRATAAFFNRPLKWSSSLKNIKGRVSFKLMLPQIFALIASIFALIIAAFHLQKTGFKAGPIFLFFKAKILGWFGVAELGQQSVYDIHQVMKSGYTFDLVLVAGIWVIYNIFRVIFFIKKVINDSKNSHEFFRFKTPFAVTFNADKKIFGRILEISEEWLKCCSSNAEVDYKIGDCQKILLHLPTKILPLQVTIEKISGKIFEGKIIWNSVESRDDLANAIYSVDWHREFLNRNAYFLTPSDCLLNQIRLVSNLGKFLIAAQRVNRCIRNNFFVLRKLKFFSQIEYKLPNRQKYQAWNSLFYQGKTAVIANFLAQKNLATIIVFEELPIGSKICGYKISDVAVEEISLKILQEESLSSLVENGLDGSIVRRYTVECR